MENFGYMRKTVFASDVFEAVTIYRKALEDKFGSLDGKMLCRTSLKLITISE
jgi:hypothetical protein